MGLILGAANGPRGAQSSDFKSWPFVCEVRTLGFDTFRTPPSESQDVYTSCPERVHVLFGWTWFWRFKTCTRLENDGKYQGHEMYVGKIHGFWKKFISHDSVLGNCRFLGRRRFVRSRTLGESERDFGPFPTLEEALKTRNVHIFKTCTRFETRKSL